MKLRKIFATAAMALLVGVGASAQVSKEDVRIYINPGHGSWGPNNRHMATIGHDPISSENPDTTDFYESNTNLRKGLALLYRLHDYGVPFDVTKNQTNDNPNRIGAALDLTQNLVMSHVKCGPYPYETVNGVSPDSGNDFNRTLATIAAEVEANDFDMFISIHSNATTEGSTTNYLYFAWDNQYINSDGTPKNDEGASIRDLSIEMSEKGWNHRILDRHTQWSHYDNLVGQGTVKIGQQNLGVLNHSVPGYLVEGYFHTYQPARHRYMNFDMCRLEGIDYARGVADYFGWEKEETGDIVGVVRDRQQKFSHDLYNPKAGTYDVYKPLNGVAVTLKKGEETVATYTTDENYNGLFAFRDLKPGDYTVTFSHADYKADSVYTSDKAAEEVATSIPVTVKAATTVYPTAFLESKYYVAPSVVYVNYPDSTAGKAEYKLISFYEVKAKESNLLAEQLAGKTVRRQIVRDNKLYVLALDADNEPYIYFADIAAGTVTELDKAAVVMGDNGKLKISDIALTADHVLIANGKSWCHYDDATASGRGETRGTVNVYKWAVDEETGAPTTCELWFTTKTTSNMTNAITGNAMAYSGTVSEGKMTLTTQHGTKTSLIAMRMERLEISEGQYIGDERLDTWASGYNETINKLFYAERLSSSDDYELAISPRNDEYFIMDGNNITPMEFFFKTTGAAKPATINNTGEETLVATKVNGANYFKYAGRSLMVAPDVNGEGKVAGLKLFDITEGIAKAKEITLEGATLAEPVEYKYASAHGELKLTFSDVTGYTTGATIELFLVVDGKVTKYTAGDFYSSVNLAKNSITGTANPFAYALSSEIAEKTLKVKYTLNTDATAVTVNVKDAEGEVVATATGATTKGAQTVDVALADLVDGEYTWEVVVDGAVKSNIERFVSHKFYHPSGLDIDNSFESGSFGTLFVCEGYNRGQKSGYVSAHADGSFGGGLYIFDPQNNQVLNKDGKARFYPSWMTNTDRSFGSLTCGADFGKVAIAEDGRIFVNRYNFEGDYYLYAESLEKLVADGEFTSLLAGKTMTDGIYFDEAGNYLAGPAQSFDVKGSGDDLKLIALSRNDKTTDATFDENRVVEYELGTGKELSTPTLYTALDQKYTISYDRKSNLQYDNRGGVWYIQYRGTPSDSQPALIYVDENGEIKYFEGAGGKSRYQGALSVAPDGNSIVASSASGIVSVYEIIRAEDGSVFLNEAYRLTHNMGGSAYSAAWDIAGNFYLGNASNEVVQGYALPRAEAAVTKAASVYSFTVNGDTIVGIDEIEAEDANAPVEYYNLQGMKVANPEKGIFIKKQGGKTTKVVL